MKYYLIAGEASGDLHASHLMAELKKKDAEADFRFYGGDLMAAQGGTLVRHYRDLAYMGFIPVLLHLRTILTGMSQCQQDILAWQPDVLILVDYPGFNLRMAKFVHRHSQIPVYYYIAPKIWAWKERRIHQLRQYVTELFSILPFEVDFFQGKHHYPIHYVGNSTLDEIAAYTAQHPFSPSTFRAEQGLDERPIIALLAGSRRQEIQDNLPRMIQAAEVYSQDYQLVLAAAPGIEDSYYEKWIQNCPVRLVRGETFRLLQHSTAALVTSGTATLETALFRVPQVVCYYMKAGWLASLGKRLFLKIPYISLVNLIANRAVVPELVGHEMNVSRIRRHLRSILPGGEARQAQLDGYEEMAHRLGSPGAPERAASIMQDLLGCRSSKK